ncbi:hypothetical protein ACT17_15325 [Mycolicibacterium conceptionense]|uniref:Uncharacterized protein n=1 Tax=Mycolicibacterium conceptionense TaxID=451644 RepID=A0A0J8U8A4_9MYCO|nr:transcriptional regulator [Mycolicibacterium conceptionense]KMV17646.1 hypothetical protein ACT17_15325 [Mycolicibacterium conceptionense]
MNRPDAPAEGKLIESLRKDIKPPLTLKAAAAEIGISDRRWRQIETGYKLEGGAPIPVHAPADTLVRMAKVVGATSEQLLAGGRADAAELLDKGVVASAGVRGSGGKRTAAADGAFTADEKSMVASVAVQEQRIAMRVAALAETESDPRRATELVSVVDELIAAAAAMSHLVARTASVADSMSYQSALAEVIARRNRARRNIEGGQGTTAEDIAAQETRTHEYLLGALLLEKDRLDRGDEPA